jgi:GDP-L-fucose synthase
LHRFHNDKVADAASVTIWGDGTPLREFLHVDDLARACLRLLEDYDETVAINVGSGQEISIANLAELISEIVGFKGSVKFNTDRPNGTPRKLLNSEKITMLGWKPEITLLDGITTTYNWFLENRVRG